MSLTANLDFSTLVVLATAHQALVGVADLVDLGLVERSAGDRGSSEEESGDEGEHYDGMMMRRLEKWL